MSDQESTLVCNLNDLSIGEIVSIEELTGLPFDAMTDPDKPKGKLLQAIAYISKRRDNPEFTFEDAGNLKLNLASDEADFTQGDE